MRILVVAKNRIKNRKNVCTTVARGARMILIAKNAPKKTKPPTIYLSSSRDIQKNVPFVLYVCLDSSTSLYCLDPIGGILATV